MAMHESFYQTIYNKFPSLIFCSSEHLKFSKNQLWTKGGSRKNVGFSVW